MKDMFKIMQNIDFQLMFSAAMRWILSPNGILSIAFLLLVLGRFVFKKRYLNCFEIIENHVRCFRNNNGKISYLSIFLYFGVPMLIALALLKIRTLDEDVVNILTIIISILTSMFFTLLTLILDMRSKVKNNPHYNAGDAELSRKILKETYYTLMFEIMVSIVILIMCFIELFTSKFSILSGLIIYYLCFVLLINLFMILKRIYTVIDQDLNNS